MLLKTKKLTSGYYVIENEQGSTLKRKEHYNAMIFEYWKSAKYVINSIKLNGLPNDLII